MKLAIVVDDTQVIRLFAQAPQAARARLGQLVEGAAIDIQRAMKINSPVHDGALRNSIKYTMDKAAFKAEIMPRLKYADFVEKGTRPHWTSVRPGTPLRKWADDKGINPYAVQRSIAKKGTKGQWFINKTYNFNHRKVEGDIISGMSAFARGMNNGQV